MANFKFYKDTRGEYRWSLRSDKNGETIAVSSEGYVRKADAEASIRWMKTNAESSRIVDLT